MTPGASPGAYARVLVGTEAPGVRRTYTYRIPPEHDVEGILDRGARVVVPFGRQPLLGTILDRSPDPPGDVDDERIRDILDRVRGDGDRVPASVMEMVEYLAEQSLSGLATALRCAVPEFQSARLVKGWRRVTECAPPTNAEALSDRFDAEETNVLDETEVRSTLGDAYEAVVRKARATGWLLPAYRVAGPRIRARWVRSLSLAQSWDTTLEAARAMEGRSPARARLLRHLVEIGGGPTPAADATRAASTTAATASALERDGWIRVESLRSLRAPGRTPGLPSAPPELNTDQQGAVDHIDSLLEARQARVVLLQGVTGSGKTEVYLRAIASNRRLRRTALVLVPEIALTAQVVDLFRARLGERVAVLHSGLSEGERRDEWFRIASGDADVVVGARSAVFAPLENLGLVVMDEEHEGSYKQDSPSPRYHARDIALERARRSGAVVVLGSATPSVETRWRSEQGDWERVVLPERANRLPMPEVRIVDLRAAWKAHGPCLLAPELAEALSGTLERGEQAILFLNRRGFAMFLLCRDCGYSTRCPRCEVSLTLHRSSDRLVCHHCDHEAPVPEVCPSCGGDRLRPFGIGTERVEAEIQGLFPSARPIRMDRDTTTRKDSHRQLLGAFRRGEANILIGTQMVAKGLDFPNVTLVGVVSADTALNVPDFRASERAFQLLSQVAGRAGRAERPGTVLIQTFNPTHEAVVAAANHDYEGFYAREIEYRRELGYPPFARLANLVCGDEDGSAADRRLRSVAAVLEGTPDIRLLGPAPCPLSRLRGKYRHHLLIKCFEARDPARIVGEALERIPARERALISVDIDPISLA